MTTMILLGHAILEDTGALDYLKSGAAWIAQIGMAYHQAVPNAVLPQVERIPHVGRGISATGGAIWNWAAKLQGSFWAGPALLLSAYDGFFDLGDVSSSKPSSISS